MGASMEIFIDSANIDEIEAAVRTGLVDGVTTNPSLVAKTGMAFKDVLNRICELISGPISAEVTAPESAQMVVQGKELASMHENIVVKIPLTQEGLLATKILSSDGVKVNVTLCFSAVQAYLAAKAGATYLSPFVGRLDDIGQEGMGLITDIRGIYDNFGYKTKILVASIRHTEHVLESLRMGADVATIPYNVFTKLVNHPLTDNGLKKFMDDWKAAGLA